MDVAGALAFGVPVGDAGDGAAQGVAAGGDGDDAALVFGEPVAGGVGEWGGGGEEQEEKEGGCSAIMERSLSCVRMATLGSVRGWGFRRN